MLTRSVYILIVAFVSTASVALYLHQSDDKKESRERGEVLWDLQPEEVREFTFSSKAFELIVEAKRDSTGSFWQAQSTRTIPQVALRNDNKFPVVDRDTMLIEEDESFQKRTKQFVLGSRGSDLIHNLFPLRVRTSVENTKGREIEFGFDEDVDKFSISSATEKHTFEIGKITYGSRLRYIRDSKHSIFAIEERIIAALMDADTSLEGQVIFAEKSIDLLSFKVTGPTTKISIESAKKDGQNIWTLDGRGGSSLEAQSFVESKILPIVGRGFVPQELEEERIESLLEFKMRLRDVEGEIGGRFLLKKSSIRPVYFVQSDLTRQLVKVEERQVQDLISSLEKLAAEGN